MIWVDLKDNDEIKLRNGMPIKIIMKKRHLRSHFPLPNNL